MKLNTAAHRVIEWLIGLNWSQLQELQAILINIPVTK
jgi:hypothetical protein